MALSDGIRTIFLAGVGAIAVTGEKTKEVFDELVKKGESSVEEGKILNEDIVRKMSEKADNLKPENVARSFRNAVFSVQKMTQEQRDELRAQLDKADEEAAAAEAEVEEELKEIVEDALEEAAPEASSENGSIEIE